MKSPLLVQGMHGLGDNLHQRAVLRQLMQNNSIWLETSWASLYHDLVGPDLKLVRKQSGLRTQAKNAQREGELFSGRPPYGLRTIRVSYGGAHVLKTPSRTVLEAMCQVTGTSFADADFRLPVPDQWFDDWHASSACDLWRQSGKPLMIYRPLVARPEWRGSVARNADPQSYAMLLASIRDAFFIVSLADLAPTQEWIVGPRLIPDVTFHEGQVPFETMAAMFADADLVFTSGGFASILAPAVETPCVTVIGGYEHAEAHSAGARFAPMLALGPEKACACWSSQCRISCDKKLNLDVDLPALQNFCQKNVPNFRTVAPRDIKEIFRPGELQPATPFRRPPTQQELFIARQSGIETGRA